MPAIGPPPVKSMSVMVSTAPPRPPPKMPFWENRCSSLPKRPPAKTLTSPVSRAQDEVAIGEVAELEVDVVGGVDRPGRGGERRARMMHERTDRTAAARNVRRGEAVAVARFEPGVLTEDRFLGREPHFGAGAEANLVVGIDHADHAERHGAGAAEAVLLLSVGHVDAGRMEPERFAPDRPLQRLRRRRAGDDRLQGTAACTFAAADTSGKAPDNPAGHTAPDRRDTPARLPADQAPIDLRQACSDRPDRT